MHRGSRGLVAERGCRVRRVGYFRFARRRASRLFGFSSVRRGGAEARAGVPRAPGGVVAYTSRTRGGGRCDAASLRPTAHADRSRTKDIGVMYHRSRWLPQRAPAPRARRQRANRTV